MVRVGGGWCSLEEFLVKNDPCRGKFKSNLHSYWVNDKSHFLSVAKGRTNVELREQFVLADGVSQGMASFKPKMSISAASPGTIVPKDNKKMFGV
jgi:dystonin